MSRTILFSLILCQLAGAQGARPGQPPPQVTVTVTDENGAAVIGARILRNDMERSRVFQAETDFRGRARFPAATGPHRLLVEKPGFYSALLPELKPSQPADVQVKLRHVQEFHERMEVTDSPPAVDPAKTAGSDELTNRELFSLPYPTTRDFRQALPFIPQVVLDQNEQIHVAGAASYELFKQLDGFNITHPVTGLLDFRLSPDALRLITVQNSRYSAEFGKGSGGVMQLESGMGDDHFRVSATNFTPGLSIHNGITFENVTPRLVFSGPLVKSRAWWFEGIDGEYDTNVDRDLPKGANQNPLWRVDSLSKAQVNLTSSNILTGSFLINHEKDERVGLSIFSPPPSTTDQHHDEYLASLKDSAYFANKVLLETGIAFAEFRSDSTPRSAAASVERPEGNSGGFFESSRSRAQRIQGIANLFLPPATWHGKHTFKFGADVDAIRYRQSLVRHTIFILGENGALARSVTFTGPPHFGRENFEGSAYAQDRWSVRDRLLIEYGLRTDWDEIIRDVLVSPRLSASYLLDRKSLTKISLGSGFVYNPSNLEFLTRPLQGARIDQNFAADGVTPFGPPIVTQFFADASALKAPRFLNTSLAVERMIKNVYVRLDVLEKRGRHGFAFVNHGVSPQAAGLYVLASNKNDTYDSVSLTAHKRLGGNHELFGSYARAVARSTAVLDFSLVNPLFAQQAGGPLSWDAPNRFISWGFLPITRRLDFAFSLDYRTGFPFNVVNNDQQLVGKPNQRRFPDYFVLNTHLEHRFRLQGYEFAVRLGFNNVTGRHNPGLVNNNIDSPEFLRFASLQHRALAGRIRFLGKSK